MREIKFRYSIGDSYFYVTLDNIQNEGLFAGAEFRGQWTGLKDKKGKEIYEGDILRIKAFWDNAVEFTENVVFEQGMFGFKCDNSQNMMKISAYETEVIGDIYEE